MSDTNLYFLSHNDEMSTLIRNKDWNSNAVGSIDLWSPILKTALGIVLNSKLPMFLFWGKELICFYNDSYPQILGSNHSHLSTLGQPLESNFPAQLSFIKPFLHKILKNGNAALENQSLLVFKNGKMVDTNWNFNYSPINNESRTTEGIIITCIETPNNLMDVSAADLDIHHLAQSKIEFHKLIMKSPIPTIIFSGKNHLIEIANTAILQTIVHNEKRKMIGKTYLEAFTEMCQQQYPDLMNEIWESGVSIKEKERVVYVQSAGTRHEFYFDFECTPFYDSDETITGIIAVMYDVTEKVETRKKAEEAEERARLAIEIAEIATWDLDLQTHKMIHSESLAITFGHNNSVKMSYTQMLSQIEPYDLANIVDKAFEEAMKTGMYKYEARIIKKAGEVAWIRSHGKIFMDDNGEPVKMIGSIIDITSERKRREILMESEQKFRMLADSMSQLIWTADPMGNLNYYNLSVYTFTGLTDQQLKNGGWLQIVHTDDREQNIQAWTEAVKTGNDLVLEHRFRNAEGQYRWQLSHASAQKDVAGNVQMWVGTSTDIHSQKAFTNELEEQVQERTIELIDKNNALVKMNIQLQSFAYVTSHDLQEPLRKIQMFISRVYNDEQNAFTENAKEYFDRINIAASKMQILIQDLLAYSKTNTSDKIFVNTNLEDLAKEVINDYKEIIEETHAIIEISGLCEVHVIPFQMRQLFSNLIGNSLKFTNPSITPHIIIKSQSLHAHEINDKTVNSEKMYCHICVSDNGIGFDAQYEKRIFEIFQRLHDNREFTGTGIGLAIVKKIVENHDGIIIATGIKNKGAKFDIYIPV